MSRVSRSGTLGAAVAAALAVVAARDVLQKEHALLRNFPLVGHARYLLEALGPELRQYLVAGNNEERPFTRDQRRWVYASAKKQNNYFGFGTDNDVEYTAGYPVINHKTSAGQCRLQPDGRARRCACPAPRWSVVPGAGDTPSVPSRSSTSRRCPTGPCPERLSRR